MNADTVRTLNEVRAHGFYRKGMTLGEGGLRELYKFAGDWNDYSLYIDGDFCEKITAESDTRAEAAFHSLYRLDECNSWEVLRVETKIFHVAGNVD